MAEQLLPAIYLKPPQGYLLAKGEKTLIISPVKSLDYVDKDIYAVSGDKIYAIVKLAKPYMIPHTLFKSSYDKHKITEKEREDVWKDVKQFWCYSIISIKKYRFPIYCGKIPTHNLFIKSIGPKPINEIRLYNGKSYRNITLAEDEVLVRMKADEANEDLCLDGEASFKLFTPIREKRTVERSWQMRGGQAIFK